MGFCHALSFVVHDRTSPIHYSQISIPKLLGNYEKLSPDETVELNPGRSDGTMCIPPIRCPGERHKFEGDVGFDGFDGEGFEPFIQRVRGRGECIALGFELRFKISQLFL